MSANPDFSPVSPGPAPVVSRLAWPQVVLPLSLIAVMLWLFRDTAAAMVGIWARSETFQHGFLVPPIVGWLVWRKRAELAKLPVRPMPWVLLPMVAACFVWLLAELASVNAASQFAFVALIVLTVPALLGAAFTRALIFPLGFLFFAVPFGEFMVPTLINYTADFTVSALRFTGIPVFREGNDFVIPSGSWSVVAACSGVRYLIASVMVGTLFAYLNYQSPVRRLLFVGVAIVVPIVANWMRAYMIVMIGHLSGNTLAVGVDHLIYGWVFFGVVVGLMFMIGIRWSEPDPKPAPATNADVREHRAGRPAWVMLGAVLALLIGAQALLWRLEDGGHGRPVALDLPAVQPGVEMPFVPGWQAPSASAAGELGSPSQPVWMWLGYYRQQGDDRKLVSSVNLTVAADDRRWAQTGRGTRKVELADGDLSVRTADLRQEVGLTAGDARRLRVWQLYWVGGRFEASDARAKIWQALDRLRGRGGDGAVILLATPAGADADDVLAQVARTRLGHIAAQLSQVRDAP